METKNKQLSPFRPDNGCPACFLHAGRGGGLPQSGESGNLLVKEVVMNSGAGSATRSTTSLSSGDIGVFRAKGTTTNSSYPDECNNYKYSNSGSGWTSATPVYLTGEDIDVCAYYPYDATFNDKSAIPLTSGWTAGVDAVPDLCYAINQTVNATKAKRFVSFTMNHAMAWLELVLCMDAGATSLKLTQITVSHFSLVGSAKLDITDGTQKDDYVTGKIATANGYTLSISSTTTISALLVPFSLGDTDMTIGFIRELTSVTGTYVTSNVTIPAALFAGKLEAGKRYRIKIAVNGMAVTGVEEIAWTTSDVGNSTTPFPI